MTVYFLSALSPNLELIPVVITMAICSIKADVNCKDNDTLRWSDQTYIENNLLVSDQWYNENSFLGNAWQTITYQFLFFVSFFFQLQICSLLQVLCLITQPKRYKCNTSYPKKVRFLKLVFETVSFCVQGVRKTMMDHDINSTFFAPERVAGIKRSAQCVRVEGSVKSLKSDVADVQLRLTQVEEKQSSAEPPIIPGQKNY